jgi:hypothetical protein
MGQSDQRAEGRVKALLRARLSGYGFERDGCVLDVSPQGLLVTTAIPPRIGQVVTVAANGYAMTGEVKWVSERRFGIALDEDIVVGDVIDARILNPGVRQASKALPENFGIRPQQASTAIALTNLFESQWARYAAIVLVGGGMAIYAGFYAGHHAGKMADQMATVHEASQAESRAMGK